MDRIDLHVEVPVVPFTQLAEMPPGQTSAELREIVLQARLRQAKRFGPRGPQVNGRMTPRQVRRYCALKPEALAILKAAMKDMRLSARAREPAPAQRRRSEGPPPLCPESSPTSLCLLGRANPYHRDHRSLVCSGIVVEPRQEEGP